MELKIGDVVRLKSDVDVDVLMTINGHSSDGQNFWHCIWLLNKELRAGSFHKEALIKVD